MRGIAAFGLSALATSQNRNDVATPEGQVAAVVPVVPITPAAATTSANGRRDFLQTLFVGGAATALVSAPAVTNALDMDAFMNAELEADKKNCDPKRDPKCIPKLSSDEALCKYGQSGNAKSEACKRVRSAGGEMPDNSKQGKSLGGAYAM